MAGIFAAAVFIFVVLFAELPKGITSSAAIGNQFCQKVRVTEFLRPPAGRDSQCLGSITYHICGGNCLSSQTPTLGSRYTSDHPVCAYAGQHQVRRAITWKCPSSSDPIYEGLYVNEPLNCECSVCNSSYVFCGSPYKRTMNSHIRSQPSFRRIYIPKSVAESKKRKEWTFESLPSIYLI